MTGDQLLPAQWRDLIAIPVLARMGRPYASDAALTLLCMIAAHESRFAAVRQVAGWSGTQILYGPARGLLQMEPPTEQDNLEYLDRKGGGLRSVVHGYQTGIDDELTWNMAYQVAIARVHLWRVPAALPDADDLDGLAHYAKRYWNTHQGAAKPDDYLRAFNNLYPSQRWPADPFRNLAAA